MICRLTRSFGKLRHFKVLVTIGTFALTIASLACRPDGPPPPTVPSPVPPPIATALPPRICEKEPGSYIFILNGPLTREETKVTRPGLYSMLLGLLNKEFTLPGSQRVEIALLKLTDRSDSNPVKKFDEFTCIEQEPIISEPTDLEDCYKDQSGLIDPRPCLERNEKKREAVRNLKAQYTNRINQDIRNNQDKLKELRTALDEIPVARSSTDIWGGLSLASREMKKRPSWRRLVVVIAEDEKEGKVPTYIQGCCNLKDIPLIFLGFASDSLKITLMRRDAWKFWVESGEAASPLCLYTHNEDILTLFACPGANIT